MQQGQIGGNVGPFIERSTGQQTGGHVSGNFTFESQSDVSNVMPMIQQGLVNAVTRVVQQKLDANQVALGTLAQSLPHFIPEIIAMSGAAAYGAQITNLQLQLQLGAGGVPAAPQPPQQMPPTPMQSMQNSLAQKAKDRLDPNNYEVRAQVNVGGFKIKASTDGGLDTAGLMNQAKDKAKSTVIWWGIGCAIIGLVGLGGLGLAWYIYSNVESGSTPSAAKTAKVTAWDGKTPLTCSMNDHLKVDGVTANIASGSAVVASGNCTLEITGSNITAPTAIEASGNAKVTVSGGSVSGSTLAATASGNAQITFQGTSVTGKTKKTGLAKITGP